jgi:hypothetical protein
VQDHVLSAAGDALGGSITSLSPAKKSRFWAVCLPELWSLPLVSFSRPFLGAFFFIKVRQGFIIFRFK